MSSDRRRILIRPHKWSCYCVRKCWQICLAIPDTIPLYCHHLILKFVISTRGISWIHKRLEIVNYNSPEIRPKSRIITQDPPLTIIPTSCKTFNNYLIVIEWSQNTKCHRVKNTPEPRIRHVFMSIPIKVQGCLYYSATGTNWKKSYSINLQSAVCATWGVYTPLAGRFTGGSKNYVH